MNKKYKILIILFILALTFCAGITYSIFHSNTTMTSVNQNIAKFVFNAEDLDELEFSLVDLNPGDSKEYSFSVSNNYLGKLSAVAINYQMTIKTYHLVPLGIELYKINEDETEELIVLCDETFTRNEQNELICNTPMQEMGYSSEELDNYKLKVNFSNEYDQEKYSNLIDYVNIEIKSWQKIEG